MNSIIHNNNRMPFLPTFEIDYHIFGSHFATSYFISGSSFHGLSGTPSTPWDFVIYLLGANDLHVFLIIAPVRTAPRRLDRGAKESVVRPYRGAVAYFLQICSQKLF